MPRFSLLDAFHLSIRARPGLPDAEYIAMRRTLDNPRFQSDPRRAIRTVFQQHTSPNRVRIRLTR
jgi:hypothetical protein